MRTPTAFLAGTWAIALAQTAFAAEVTPVVSSRSLKDFDVTLSLDWFHESTAGSIRRESVEATGVALTDDVTYHQVRDSMLLRGEIGLVQDLSFFLAGSFVLADNRGLDFDRSGDCASTTNPCVESLLRDGILPGTQSTTWGLDSENNRRFQLPSSQVFSGPSRSGLEYLGLGLRWAAMNQARDLTKPTWIVSFETRLSVSDDQRFDPGKPTANRGVGLGYHQIILSTMFSRKFGAYEPYLGGWFMQPVLTSDSVFKDQGTDASAQRRTGGSVGIEATVWDDPRIHSRLALEAVGRLEYRFAGLAQSELWEVLSGDSRCSATSPSFCRPGIDVDANNKPAPNSGVLRSPAYGLSGADVGLSAHFGSHVRLRALFGMLFQEAHFLSDGSSGNSVYDIPGRRFKADGLYSWHVLASAAATF
jgi:hypothetical protein